MKRVWSALLLLLVIVMTGCGKKEQGNVSSDAKKILFTFSKEEGNTFRDVLSNAALEQAKKVGAELTFEDPGFSIEKQTEQIRAAKSNGYSGIICIPEDASTAKQLMDAAGDLPIVFVNTAPSDELLKKDQYIYVGSNESVAGKYQAEYVLKKLSAKKEINVVILKGNKGHSAMIGRTQALKKALEKSDIKVNIVFEDYANFNFDTAKELMNVLIQTKQPFECVLGNNDAIALGAIEAMKENNISTDEIPVLGVDGTAEGCKAIQSGELQFSVYQSASGQGEYAMKSILALVNQEKISQFDYASKDELHVWVPFEKITKDNISKYIQTK